MAEDTRFLWHVPQHAIQDLNTDALAVGIVHPSNTATKIPGPCWEAVPVSRVTEIVGPESSFYSSLRRGSATPRREDCKWPLISCMMPTRDRRAFVAIALGLFAAQDYSNRELIIVDDGVEPIQDLIPPDQNIRHIHAASRLSIGAKRNLACWEARGEIVAHWDDDDWYAPDRLRMQVSPILSGEADVTGLDTGRLLQLPQAEFWTVTPRLHERMFVGNVHGGTLMFRRSLLTDGVSYPEVDLAEDAALLSEFLRRGKRLRRVVNDGGLFVYVRHSRNAWTFPPGRFMDNRNWLRVSAPSGFPAELIAQYKAAALLLRP